MTCKLTVEPSFIKGLKSLPPDRARAAAKSLELFMESQALPRFRYRPLQGIAGYFIINAKGGDRIILKKHAVDDYSAVDVGPHDNIYRKWNRL